MKFKAVNCLIFIGFVLSSGCSDSWQESHQRALTKVSIGGPIQKQVVRSSDTVARIGGDEFAAILLDIDQEIDIMGMAEKLIAAINTPIQIGDLACQIGVSIGICLYPADGDNPEKLLKHADLAIYDAKENGKNKYCFYGNTVWTKGRLPHA